MRPIIAAAISLGLGACSPHYFTSAPAWQPYFKAVREGKVHSICDDAARSAVNRAGGRLAIVLTETGEPHMVAIDGDGMVRDNRVPGGEPVFWFELPYQWIAEEN